MRHRLKVLQIHHLIWIVAIVFPLLAVGESGAAEFGDFALEFGRIDCGSPTACEGDFDEDGDVDGKDVCSMVQQLLPEISFSTLSSTGGEGETIPVGLVFSGPYSGDVALEVSGPATDDGGNDHGLACSGPECTAWTSDSQPTLEVPVTDDEEIEEMEWLRIRLVPGPGYRVGALAEHVVNIEDNDAVWEGLFSTTGEELGFSLQILRSGPAVTAKLLAEGGGIIPGGVGDVNPEGLPFSLSFDLDPGLESFSAILPAVPLDPGSTLLGTEAEMWIELVADEITAGRVACSNNASRLRINYPDQPQLNSDVPGNFVLQRRPANPSSWQVPLETMD